MGIFYPEAFRLWLPYHLLVFKGDGGLAVVHAIPDVVFILQDAFYLCYRPRIGFFLWLSLINICESAISGVVQPTRGRNLLTDQDFGDSGSTRTMDGKIIYFLNDPPCFLIDDQFVFDFRMFQVSDGGIGTNPFAC